MTHPSIIALSSYLICTHTAQDESLIPCTEYEVQELERVTNHRLPQVYRDFLLTMGKKAGAFGQGIDMFHGNIMGLDRPRILRNLKTNEVFSFPQNAFIFVSNQGCEVFFFELNNEDNPRVNFYSEGESDCWEFIDTLGSFFLDYARSWTSLCANLQQEALSKREGKR